ncbi:MAG: DoxX family membrane protein [Ignavibacteriae bacterium]|nr:DoxX family membrane protein [Ignavibacteria bacterium]MBI3365399.1 DoxX family membrane protein [Ignavibacteriota bacterium]
MKISNMHIVMLRVVLGVLFIFEGWGKIEDGWLSTSAPLAERLASFHQRASGLQLTYLDNVAIPYANIWSRLMALGETALGISLVLGLLVHFSTAIGILMVLNFHAANGTLFAWIFFGTPWAAFLVSSLLILFLARAGRWAGFDALLAKSNAKGMLW